VQQQRQGPRRTASSERDIVPLDADRSDRWLSRVVPVPQLIDRTLHRRWRLGAPLPFQYVYST
jgi:hypothetical protein